MKTNFWTYLFLVVMVAFIFREITRPVITQQPVYNYTYVYDSIPRIVEVNKPVPFLVKIPDIRYSIIYDTIIPPIDTLAILQDYLATVTYIDTLVNDKDLLFELTETLHRNRIEHRSFTYVNRRPVSAIVTVDVLKPKNTFYFGPSVNMNKETFGAGGSVALRTTGDNVFQYHYDFINKVHQGTILWPIKF